MTLIFTSCTRDVFANATHPFPALHVMKPNAAVAACPARKTT
jgi:hypothetical protein